MLAMDVWCFSKSTIRVDLEKHQTRLHYWGNSLCNFEESPLQLWGILLYNKHSLWDTCGGSATRSEADRLPEEKKRELLAYLKTLPIYKIITVKGEQYFLTHSGYNVDYAVQDPETGLIDIRKSVDQAAAADMERYLFSDDIHFIPASVRFDRKIIVGHYPVIFLPDHGTARIYHGSRYTDIDTGNERRDAGGRLSCLRLDDGREFYV